MVTRRGHCDNIRADFLCDPNNCFDDGPLSQIDNAIELAGVNGHPRTDMEQMDPRVRSDKLLEGRNPSPSIPRGHDTIDRQ